MAKFTVVGPHRMVLDKRGVFEPGDELEMDFERGNRFVQQGHLALVAGSVSDGERARFMGETPAETAEVEDSIEGVTGSLTDASDDDENGDGR